MKLEHAEGALIVEETGEGRRKVRAEPVPGVFSPMREITTEYPVELLSRILETKGVSYVVNEIARDVDPGMVQASLLPELDAYFHEDEINGKRVLDFGCGAGASTMILARRYPEAHVTGVELADHLLDLARARLDFYQYPNVELHVSPSPTELPAGLGQFDVIIFSAVFEHLLPNERQYVMPLIWGALKPGGKLFINQTPHRYFPHEGHTTGLPLINYLPDSLTGWAARTWSDRDLENDDWSTLLRKGIRGGTEAEMVRCLGPKESTKAEVLEPSRNGVQSRLDLWFSQLSPGRRGLKKAARAVLRGVQAVTGSLVTPNVTLVIRKG